MKKTENADEMPAARRSRTQLGPGPIVRSICITMVKNEQDIIEPFLRHNRRFFDAMIVLDNRSTDRTLEIVTACAREMGGIIFTDLPRFDYAQSEVMTAALHHAQATFFADFVCFLDADEFISAPDRATFDRLISTVPVGNYSLHAWRTFLHDPALTEADSPDPLHRMTYRRTHEKPSYRKAILRMGGGVRPDLIVEQGNHAIAATEGMIPQSYPIKDLSLMHFPIRSAQQLASRGVIGWMANVARGPQATLKRAAYQWKRIHDLACQSGTALSSEVVADEGMAYAQRTSPARFHDNAVVAAHGITTERRYSTGEPGDPFKLVSAAWAASALPDPVFTLQTRALVASEPRIEHAFDDNWHWQNLFLDVAPFRYLAQKYLPQSAFDIGCGNGVYLRLLLDSGVPDIFGVDGIAHAATVLPAESYAQVDLQVPQDFGRRFDMVLCLEVVEHITPACTEILIDTIARHASDLIVFSMAEPKQPGNGHINCRPMAEVLDLWASRGWAPDLVDTLGIRALASTSWFRRNLLVLKPAKVVPDAASAGDALRKIGALSYRWYNQSAGVRASAFQEAYPDPTRAYGVVLPPAEPEMKAR